MRLCAKIGCKGTHYYIKKRIIRLRIIVFYDLRPTFALYVLFQEHVFAIIDSIGEL